MAYKHASELRIGQFIQSSDHYLKATTPEGGRRFIGTVVGMTVNATGEPILVCHIITRKFAGHKTMVDLGYRAVDNTHVSEEVDVFYEYTGPMHPVNLTAMDDSTYLTED